MTLLPAGVKVHLALGHIDMRKGMDGLAMLVQAVLQQDPFSGHLFVFRGRKANLIKIVFWDGTGLCLFTKRLEHGVFLWPPNVEPGRTLSLTSAVVGIARGDRLAQPRASMAARRGGMSDCGRLTHLPDSTAPAHSVGLESAVAIDLAALPDDVATLHRMVGELATTARQRADAGADRDRSLAPDREGAPAQPLRPPVGTPRRRPAAARPGRSRCRHRPGGGRAPAAGGERAGRVSDDRPGLPDHLPREDVMLDIAPAPALLRRCRSMRSARRSARCWTMCRHACVSCASAGPNMAAAPAAPSTRRRRPSGRSRRDSPARGCWPMCWSASIATTFRSTASRRSSPARASLSIARPWRTGSAVRAGGSKHCASASRAHIFASGKLFADDTPLPVLDPGRGQTLTGRLWVYVRDDRPWSGTGSAGGRLLLQSGPQGRTAGGSSGPVPRSPASRWLCRVRAADSVRGEIMLAACWAHTRRKFYDVHQATGSPIAAEALRRIAGLYAIETGDPRPQRSRAAGCS